MRQTVKSHLPTSAAQGDHLGTVRNLLLLSAAALIAQVGITDYGADTSGAAALWVVIGCVLLWLVHSKRSRVARGLIVVTSMVGAVLYSPEAFSDVTAAALVIAYVGQAAPLMSSPVRHHVSPAAR